MKDEMVFVRRAVARRRLGIMMLSFGGACRGARDDGDRSNINRGLLSIIFK